MMNIFLKFLFIFLLIEIIFATNFSFLSFVLFFFFIVFETFGKTKSFKKLLEGLFLTFIFFILAKDYHFPHFHLFAFIFALIFSSFFYSFKVKTTSYYFPLIYFLFLIFYKNKMPLFILGLFTYFLLVFILGKIFSLKIYQKYLFGFLIIEILIPISFLSIPAEIKSLIAFLLLFGIFGLFYRGTFVDNKLRYFLSNSK